MRTIIRLGCLVVLLLAASAAGALAQDGKPAKRMQKYAVLVGINKYAGSFANLSYCHNDMLALKARLLAVGFEPQNIVFLHDGEKDPNLWPSKSNIESQLKLRMALALPSDLVLVAFSGHGLLVEKKSYLCPLDAKLDDAKGTMVSVDNVYSEMEASKAAQKLLVIDACRNDPTKGIKSVKSGDIALKSPSKGLRVLSSCDAGQYSLEDPKLKRGVFMYYVTKGLEGAADAEVEGNKNGRISLDELYHYAHEKTKVHVANTYALQQMPVLKGEIVGQFEIAAVPDPAKLEAAVDTTEQADFAAANPRTEATTRAPHPLLMQADLYYKKADYIPAIDAYKAVIDATDTPPDVRRAARMSRAICYQNQGGKDNIKLALNDVKAAGKDSITLTILKPAENLMVGTEVKAVVKQNEIVQISLIDGEWLWVCSVGNVTDKTGYIKWDAILPQVAKPNNQNFDFYDGDDE